MTLSVAYINYITSNGRLMNNMQEKDMAQIVMGWFQVLSWRLPADSEKTITSAKLERSKLGDH
jgi:hypothetical protein